MNAQTVQTYTIQLYMAGDIDTAKQVIREVCYPGGLCVTVTPTSYIYAGGEEEGFVVGFINYPRFPVEPGALWDQASNLAELLRERCFQHSYTLVAPDLSMWKTVREGT